MSKEKLTLKLKSIKENLSFKLDYQCSVSWDEMKSINNEERVKFCRQCNKNVYDLIGMPNKNIIDLLNLHGTEICGQVKITDDDKVIFDQKSKGEQVRGNLTFE